MKKYLFIALLLMILFIVSCTSSVESDIENVISDPENNKTEPELVEEETDDEVEEYIEFFLDDEQVTINLRGLPILNNYLQGASNREQSIEEMELTRIYSDEESIYLLKFSCYDSFCSYIILNQNRDNPSFLIADLARLSETRISPEASKLLFLFERDSGPSEELKDIVVIDIGDWSRLQLVNETTADPILDYKWPLSEVEWVDDDTISVNKPDSIEPEDSAKAIEETPVTNVILRVFPEGQETDNAQ
ncbi:hypothetical protein ACDX78_00870 [Virgibacillus oceani]